MPGLRGVAMLKSRSSHKTRNTGWPHIFGQPVSTSWRSIRKLIQNPVFLAVFLARIQMFLWFLNVRNEPNYRCGSLYGITPCFVALYSLRLGLAMSSPGSQILRFKCFQVTNARWRSFHKNTLQIVVQKCTSLLNESTDCVFVKGYWWARNCCEDEFDEQWFTTRPIVIRPQFSDVPLHVVTNILWGICSQRACPYLRSFPVARLRRFALDIIMWICTNTCGSAGLKSHII